MKKEKKFVGMVDMVPINKDMLPKKKAIKKKVVAQEEISGEVLQEQKHFVIKGMKTFGGGFCFALAALIQRADHENLKKLYQTFNKEWNKYLEMGKAYEKRTR